MTTNIKYFLLSAMVAFSTNVFALDIGEQINIGNVTSSLQNTQTATLRVGTLDTPGSPAIVGYAKSVGAPVGSQGTIGVIGYAENNGYLTAAYGGYFEARATGNNMATHGAEFNAVNQVYPTPPSVTPYSPNPNGMTAAMWASAGRGDLYPNYRISAGLGFAANGTSFDHGIVFGIGSVTQQADGSHRFLDVPDNYRISWGNGGGYIQGTSASITLGVPGKVLTLNSNGIYINGVLIAQ